MVLSDIITTAAGEQEKNKHQCQQTNQTHCHTNSGENNTAVKAYYTYTKQGLQNYYTADTKQTEEATGVILCSVPRFTHPKKLRQDTQLYNAASSWIIGRLISNVCRILTYCQSGMKRGVNAKNTGRISTTGSSRMNLAVLSRISTMDRGFDSTFTVLCSTCLSFRV